MKQGAARRRQKRQRALARQAIVDYEQFCRDQVPRLLGAWFAAGSESVRGSAQRLQKAPGESGVAFDLVRSARREFEAIGGYVEGVVTGSLPPEAIGLSADEFARHQQRLLEWLPEFRRLYDPELLEADLAAVYAAAIAAVVDHRLYRVTSCYSEWDRRRRRRTSRGPTGSS